MTDPQISDSKFHMWRTLVALVHADHVITAQEVDFFKRRFDVIPFTAEQKEILLNELDTEQPLNDLFEQITDKADRATLIHFARLLFWCDGEFAEQEETILKHLHSQTVKQINMDETFATTRQTVARTMAEYDEEQDEQKGGFIQRLLLMDIF